MSNARSWWLEPSGWLHITIMTFQRLDQGKVQEHIRTKISSGLDVTYVHLWFCGHLSRQAPHALCVEFSACDITFDSLAVSHDTCVDFGCDGVVAEFSLWNHDSVLSDTVLLALLCTCEDGVETLVGTIGTIFLCSGNDAVAIRGTTFDDGTRPGGDEIVGDALYLWLDTFAFWVK